MRPACLRSDSTRPFLEPPHSHDPTAVSLIGSLPPSLIAKVSPEAQTAIWNLQESLSVAAASYQRLQDLIEDRFERFMPYVGPEDSTFAESMWFNYSNQLEAERDYLCSEAVPDVQYKVTEARLALQPFFELTLPCTDRGRQLHVEEWWSTVHSSLAAWTTQVLATQLPELEETMEDCLAAGYDDEVIDTEEASPVDTVFSQESFAESNVTSPASITDQVQKLTIASPPPPPFKELLVAVKPIDVRKDSGIIMIVE